MLYRKQELQKLLCRTSPTSITRAAAPVKVMFYRNKELQRLLRRTSPTSTTRAVALVKVMFYRNQELEKLLPRTSPTVVLFRAPSPDFPTPSNILRCSFSFRRRAILASWSMRAAVRFAPACS